MPERPATRTPLLPGSGPLAGVPPLVAFVVVVGLFTAGVLIKGVLGAVLLGLLAAGLAVLLAATWPRLTTPNRVARAVVLAVLVAVAVSVL